LSSLINGCDIADEEHEKLRDVLGKVQAGESREVLIHTSHSDRERRVLRFVMHGMDDDQSVICCVSDCTQAQASMDRVEIEQNFMESVRAKTTSIWQINVTKNRWALLHSKKSDPLSSLKIEKNSWRDYEADLVGCIRDHLSPADYEAYAKSMSLASLAYDFRSGNYELNRDYRVHSKSTAEYAWHRTCIRIWMNPYSKDIIANMYVFNVDAEKNAELERGERKRILNETLRALGGIYYGLYYVDLEKDLCYAAKPLGGELVSQLCAPYKQTFDGYIENSVHPDDREALREMLSAYALRRGMKEGSHFKRMAYKRKVGDGFENAQIIIQPARFENGDVKEVVLAIRYLKQKSE